MFAVAASGKIDADFCAGVFGAVDFNGSAKEGRAHFHAAHSKMGLLVGAAVVVDADSVVVNHHADFVFALLNHNACLLRLCVVFGIVERLLDYAKDVMAVLGGKKLQVNLRVGVKTYNL